MKYAILPITLLLITSSAPAETEWSKLRTLLSECTGVATNPLPAAEIRMLTGAPLLGNGEIGVAVESDGNRLSYSVGHASFRRYAIGGVDLLVEGKPTDQPDPRHEQDIERAEIRSTVNLGGCDIAVTSWVATDQPLLICEVNNPSDQPLTLKVNTWTRPGLNLKVSPFRLVAGSLGTYNLAECLNDRNGKVVYGRPAQYGADWWRYVQVDNLWCLKNEATGRYMAITDAGEIVTVETPDKTANFRHTGKPVQGAYQWTANGHYINHIEKADGSVQAVATRRPATRATAVEYAAHYHTPSSGGHVDDACWAWRSYTGWGNEGGRAIACLGTHIVNARVGVEDATLRVVVPARGRVTIAVATIADFNHSSRVTPPQQCRDQAMALAKSITTGKVDELSRQRISEWRDYWMKAWLDTGDPLLNRYWYGSMYLLKCAHRAGQQSAALFGVWNFSDNSACQNREFNNYNYQSQHYGTFTANRGEQATAQFDDILRELPVAQRRAARAGYQGATWPRTIYHHFPTPVPTRFPQPKVAGHKNRGDLGNDQLDAAAFLAMNFMYHYETTLDREFLEKKAYPMVRACADFYTDYLYFNEAKDRYELQRSAAREGTNDNNPAYPLAYIKRIALAAANYSEVLGVDADHRAKWRDIAARMSAYPTTAIGGKTMFRETESHPRVLLRGPGDNVSLLQIIHPGEGVGLDSDVNLLAIARNTLAYANSNTNKPSWLQKSNNLPLIYVQAASIGWDADDLYSWFHRYLEEEERPNLTYQSWGIEGPGGTEGLHRMLFQSRGPSTIGGQSAVLRFFPVWPRDKDAEFHRLRAFGAFLVSAELQNGVVSGVKIISEKGSDCSIVNPWPGASVRVVRNGKQGETVQGERFTLKTTNNESIELIKE